MSDTSLRYLSMLQFIPRYPGAVSTLELQQKLIDSGFEINLRTIQRDLEKLSATYPLICEEGTRPFKWSFSADSAMRFLPALDIPSAVALELARAYLKPLLPPKLLNHLNQHFKMAEEVLKRNGKPISHWPEKIRLISRGFIGKRPEIKAEHLEIVAEAILKKEQCHAEYQGRKWDQKRSITILPLGLIFRDPNTYVLAKIIGKENVRQLSLHRFYSITKSGMFFEDDFDIDEFIEAGEMHIVHSREKVNLKIHCKKPEMAHLLETPIEKNQMVSEEDENSFVTSVQLADSADLRWWLIAQSAHIQIKEPEWLRNEIVKALTQGLANQEKQ